jgi:oxaloacetate decarboxylase (Na+ extruding) subunit alpha
MGKLQVTELVLRDGHQSLLATRMKIDDMLPALAKIDRAGFWSVESWGGATFDTCIRFLNEDPWERIRTLSQGMPNSRMQMLLRGQNVVGYRHYPDDVVEAFVKTSAANGVKVFRIFDALNDLRNLTVAIQATKRANQWAEGCICYTTSPIHSTDLFIQQGLELKEMGCDSICIKDMAGLLTPPAAKDLIKGLKAKVGLPVHLHTHDTAGLASMTNLAAIEAGCDIVDTSISSLSGSSGHQATESLVAALAGTEWDTGLDLGLLLEIAQHFKEVRKKYARWEGDQKGADARILVAQVPGGMYTNMEGQLRELKQADKMDEILLEIPRVRKDFGYPPLVTPTSQIVGTQAVFNVLYGRYKTVTRESKDLLAGKYGKTPAQPNPEVQKLAGLGPNDIVDCRPADLLEPEMPRFEAAAKEKLGAKYRGVEDALTYGLFPNYAGPFFETRGQPLSPEKDPTRPVTPPAPAGVSAAAPAAPARGPETYQVAVEGRSYTVTVSTGKAGEVVATQVQSNPAPQAHAPAASPSNPGTSGGAGEPVQAGIAGAVISLKASAGSTVRKGDTLIVLESMKMEMDVKSPRDGQVESFAVKAGDKVEPGQTLLILK